MIEGVTNARHLDEVVNEVTVRCRLFHFETEQDNVPTLMTEMFGAAADDTTAAEPTTTD